MHETAVSRGGRIMAFMGTHPGVPVAELIHGIAQASPEQARVVEASQIAAMAGAGATNVEMLERCASWLEDMRRRWPLVLIHVPAAAAELVRVVPMDRIIMVANAGKGWLPGPVDPHLADLPSETMRELVLVHTRPLRLPARTSHWIDALAPSAHHHVCLTDRAHLGRLARHLTGRSVALVLGAGGARGFAHLGVWRALVEAGVPIDFVGGSSMGSFIGAQIAMGWQPDIGLAQTREIFLANGGVLDWRFPWVSLLAGERLASRCRGVFGAHTEIEDLWLPWFCVTTSLTRGEAVVHRRGMLVERIRASGSPPGIAPPVELDGELHVDGGMVDLVPAAAARAFGVGHVIAVNVLPYVARRPPCKPRGRLSALRQLWQRLRTGAGDLPILTLWDVLWCSQHLQIAHTTSRARAEADLFIEPDVSRFRLFDPKPIIDIEEIGYQTARRALASWRGPREDHP